METYLVGWPDRTWSVLVTYAEATLTNLLWDIDATADPDIASIFRIVGEGYVDLPSQEPGHGPIVHWEDLEPVQLRPPWDSWWSAYSTPEEEL